jgi:hypothetical protein
MAASQSASQDRLVWWSPTPWTQRNLRGALRSRERREILLLIFFPSHSFEVSPAKIK